MLDVFLKIDNINICVLCMENVPHLTDFLDDTELENLENILKHGIFDKMKHDNIILYTKIIKFVKNKLEDFYQSKTQDGKSIN